MLYSEFIYTFNFYNSLYNYFRMNNLLHNDDNDTCSANDTVIMLENQLINCISCNIVFLRYQLYNGICLNCYNNDI